MDGPQLVTTFDVVNFIASVTSLILAVVAIWLTVHIKGETDRVNTDTRNLLIDVKTDAKSLTTVATAAMGELSEYGKTSREVTRQIASSLTTMRVTSLTTKPPDNQEPQPQEGAQEGAQEIPPT